MPFSLPNLDLCWTLCRLCPTKLLEVEFEEPTPSWKAFNTRIVSFWCSKTTVGYLPLLPYSPTSCEVVASAISICQKTAAKLGNKYTVISQDLAVYEISYGLRKSQPEKFSNLVLLLGGFHKLMNYLKAVGSLMDGAGLKEVIVAAEILREGTANKVLSGKNMYQALHAHFQVYEGMNAF